MNRIFTTYRGARRSGVTLNPILRLLVLIAGMLCANAFGQTGIDAVLLMDSSGSMAKNDARQLRIPAAKMFMSLLRDQDRIGLISFSDNGYPVLHLTAPRPDNNERIMAAADKVSSKGVYTNLYAAVAKGVEMLNREGRPDHEKLLVLMSDGKMDVANPDEERALTQQLQGELLEAITQQRIKVYTIAFTAASDIELLQDIARQTDALFKLAETDRDLHEVFAAIFESAKQPDMLPMEGNRFVVDEAVEEVTIVASKEREDVRISLQLPDGGTLGSQDASDQLKWFTSQSFDMITVSQPQAGAWSLLSTGGSNRAYIVTNMTLNHSALDQQPETGKDLVVESWLEQDGKLLDKEAVLTNTRFELEITDPDGKTQRIELLDQGERGDRKVADGVYSHTLRYNSPGAYRLNLIARSETFQRQKTLHFEVTGPALPAPEPEPTKAAAPEPETDVAPEAAPEPKAAQAAAEDIEPQKTPRMGLIIGVFAGFNLLLGGIGFGAWWFLKKRAKKPAAADGDAEEAASAA